MITKSDVLVLFRVSSYVISQQIGSFRYIKIQPETTYMTARLRGINPYKLYNLFPGASKMLLGSLRNVDGNGNDNATKQ